MERPFCRPHIVYDTFTGGGTSRDNLLDDESAAPPFGSRCDGFSRKVGQMCSGVVTWLRMRGRAGQAAHHPWACGQNSQSPRSEPEPSNVNGRRRPGSARTAAPPYTLGPRLGRGRTENDAKRREVLEAKTSMFMGVFGGSTHGA